ncbi:MAG: hypothetical protein LHV68_04440 [Elusimicrobia bacterium]|nr:hypothetical protein [Candidatus Liberimonas magnetica]
MKNKLVLLIVLCLTANAFVSLFTIEPKTNTTSEEALKTSCNPFTALCTLIDLSINTARAQTFPLSKDKSDKTKETKQGQASNLYCGTSTSNLSPMWKTCPDMTFLIYAKSKVTDPGLTKFYPEKWRNLLIFLLFICMLYLLPRGAIDNSAMFKYRVKRL